MKHRARTPFLFLLLLLLLGLYLVAPSFINDPTITQYLPHKKLKLGLDLRGGVHLVLGVDVDKAVENELDRYVQDLRDYLTTEKIGFKQIQRSVEGNRVEITLLAASDREALQKFMLKKFSVLQLQGNSNDVTSIYHLDSQRQQEIERESISQALETIRNRIDQFGVNEPEITTQGRTRIIIQLPGLDDPERAKALIGKTAQLEFKIVSEAKSSAELFTMIEAAKQRLQKNLAKGSEPTDAMVRAAVAAELPAGTELLFGEAKDESNKQVVNTPYLVESKALLTGEMLDDARVSSGGDFNQPVVSIRFNPRGAVLFEQVTKANVGKRLAIVLDDKVSSAPTIQGAIPGGRAQITLGRLIDRQALMQEAHDLVIVLRAGALPAPVEILENRTVGPSLGGDSVRMGAQSMLVGSLAVFIFMLLYYRIPGMVANISLFYNLLYMLVVLTLFEGTLTLPGIAGLVLTLGMAVDANIIIYERIREELGLGKSMAQAVHDGFERAHLTILDANLTTLIAGLVLLQYGTGPTKGFSVTLIIGLFTSYLTSIWISKLCFHILLARQLFVQRLFKPRREASHA